MTKSPWNVWKQGADGWFKYREEGDWWHILVSHLDTKTDAERDQNHIHVKFNTKSKSTAPVVCSVKVDGVHVVNRRKMIDAINQRVPGLNLKYT